MNDQYPLVTCIITCFEKFDYLFEAVSSVLMQDYPCIELLITDDGSENFPAEEVLDYISKNKHENIKRVLVHHNETNVGTVRNINGMLAESHGEFFINLDGDDVFFDETVFSRVVRRFLDTGSDFLPCARLQCDAELNPVQVLPTAEERAHISRLNTPKKQFDSFSVYQFFNIASGSALYFSRANLEQMGFFDERYRNWQDGPRITEYVYRGSIIRGAYDIVSVKYRYGGVSTSPDENSSSVQHIRSDYVLFLQQYLIENKNNRFFGKRRERLFWYYWDAAKDNTERYKLLVKYPEKAIGVVWNKVHKQAIR